MSTPSAQTIVSKYHFPLEGAMAAWRNGDSRAGANLYLKMHRFFCVMINQNLLVTPEGKKLAKMSTVCTKDRSPGKRPILLLMAEAGFTKGLENSLLFIGHRDRKRTVEKSHF